MKKIIIILMLIVLVGCKGYTIIDDTYCELNPRQESCILMWVAELDNKCIEYLVDERYYTENGELQFNKLCFNKTEVKKFCAYYDLRLGECYPRRMKDEIHEVYPILCNDVGEGRMNEC